MTTITNVRIFSESGLSEPCDVTFAGSTIDAVMPATSDGAPDGIDGTGRVLLPGFIDTHIHLSGRAELVAMAAAGVTTAIDLGSHPASLADSLRALPGLTDIRSAGCAASAPGSAQSTIMGFPENSVVAGPADVPAFLQVRITENSDLVKIIVEDPAVTEAALSTDTIAAIVRASHEHDLLTVAHATTPTAFRLAVTAGVDIATHVPLAGVLDDDVVDAMVRQGTIVSPTLIMMRGVATARQSPSQALTAGPADSVDEHADIGSFDAALATVRQLHDAGVPIIAGTDSNPFVGLPIHVAHGQSLHEELALLVQAGLSTAQALTSATSGAAKAMRLPDRGTISPGLRADVVLVDGDPIVDIATVRTPARCG